MGKFRDILEHWSVVRKAVHKVLFFSSFVKYLELFRTQFEEENSAYSWLSGSLTPKERQVQVQQFETNPVGGGFSDLD